ncbi:MAG: enoyl-CoA hydratase/isomerase family protein [Bacteroidota bacterium]
MHTYAHWLLEIKDHIAYLTLNRPSQKNRIDTITLTELGDITQVLETDPEVWVVILQAKGDVFSAGVDVSLIGSMMGQDLASYRSSLRNAQAFLDAFEALEKPTIAALQGYVVGGGMILSLCCDFRIAAENVVFQLPEVKRSIGVIMGTQRITRTIGVSRTKEMVMLGKPVHADLALQMGLVNQLVPYAQLSEQTHNFARQFLELPPLAVGLCKKIINEGQFLERAGQDLEIEAQAALLKTDDFKEAISSFFEKRKPNFLGK